MFLVNLNAYSFLLVNIDERVTKSPTPKGRDILQKTVYTAQEISRLLQKPKIHYRVDNIPTL
jgi:hypothetical protein